MNTQQRAIIGVVIIAGFIFFQSKSAESLTTSDIQPIIDETSEAFDVAQAKVFNIFPDDDDEPLGPDPDVNKCICKGTGKIVQGDGHTTDCPYHSVSSPAPVVNEVEVVEMGAYCPTITVENQKKNYRRPLLWFLRMR
jgi:hypothetical protein